MAKLPPFAPYPPVAIRGQISPGNWESYLEAWILLVQTYLGATDHEFNKEADLHDSSLPLFVQSYVQEHHESSDAVTLKRATSITLHKWVYLLCHRLLLLPQPHETLLQWPFLSQFAYVFSKVSSVSQLLDQVWQLHSTHIEANIQQFKKTIILQLDNQQTFTTHDNLESLFKLIRLIPSIGLTFATGSELIDSLINTFPKSSPKDQKRITTFTYFILLSTIRIPKRNYSLLSDHLFTLKTDAKTLQTQQKSSLLSSIISNTNFVKLMRAMNAEDHLDGSSPARDYTIGLDEFLEASSRSRPAKSAKQKGKAIDTGNTSFDEKHVHLMSRIDYIQSIDLELGSGYIAKLLDEYGDDEQVALDHYLTGDLPSHLLQANKKELLQHQSSITKPYLKSSSTVPSRRNIHDNDEFDTLTMDTSKLHIGKANQARTADELLKEKSANLNAKIIASLAAFDPDDDERDDTYDDLDVGGAIDNTVDTDRDLSDERVERILFQEWQRNPASFGRDNTTRKSPGRANLRQQTGFGDEQIEGFVIMLQRDRNRIAALERKFANEWRGQQTVIEPRAWRESTQSDEDDSDNRANSDRGRGRGVLRGRGGRGRGGAGPGTAGPSDEKGTQRARQRKEARGAHNRKDARKKKLARGMG